MKPIKVIGESTKEKNNRLAIKLAIIGGILILVAIILSISGVSATQPNTPQFNVITYNNGNIFAIQIVPEFNMTQSATVEVMALTGMVLYQHNFTGSFSFSIPLYYNSTLEIYYEGNLVYSKLLSLPVSNPVPTSTPSTPPSWAILGAYAFPIAVIFVYDRFLKYYLENRIKAPGTYEENAFGDDVNSALILEKLGIRTKAEIDWLLQTYMELKKKGLVKNIDEMLSDSEKRVLDAYKKAKEE